MYFREFRLNTRKWQISLSTKKRYWRHEMLTSMTPLLKPLCFISESIFLADSEKVLKQSIRGPGFWTFWTGIFQMCAGTFHSIYHFLDLLSKIDITVAENILGSTLSVKNASWAGNILKPYVFLWSNRTQTSFGTQINMLWAKCVFAFEIWYLII